MLSALISGMILASSFNIQRKMDRTMSGTRTNFYGAIGENDTIIQHLYGDNGMDPERLVFVDGKSTFVDVRRELDRIREFSKK